MTDGGRQSPRAAFEAESHHHLRSIRTTIDCSPGLLESSFRVNTSIAARLWCAQGVRIVDAKKSKYYDAAPSNFERARRAFERAGLVDEWQHIVQKVRRDHHRTGGFMAGFEEIVAGSRPSRKPSFLQRATARWT